jgi:hypothetical protein
MDTDTIFNHAVITLRNNVHHALHKMHEIGAGTDSGRQKGIEQLASLRYKLEVNVPTLDDANVMVRDFKNAICTFINGNCVTKCNTLKSYIDRLSACRAAQKHEGDYRVLMFDHMCWRAANDDIPYYIKADYYPICIPLPIEELAMMAAGVSISIDPTPMKRSS